MNGYKMHGSIVMNNIQTSASTYCENIGYGKAVSFSYCYRISSNSIRQLDFGNINTFVTNGFDSYEGHYTYTSATNYCLAAFGQHRVKASSYMIWNSSECDDDTHVGSVTWG